jgi:two-component system OmpR family sensor kinase
VTDAFSTKWNATSLRTKMTTVSVLLLTIGLCVAGLGSISVLRNYLTGETDHKIDSLISTLNGQVLELSYTTDGIGCNAVAVPDYYIAVLDESGAIICDNITYPSPQPDPDAMAGLSFTSQDQAFTVQSSTGNGQWRIAGLPKTTPNNEYLTLIVGQNLAGTDVLISRFAAIFLFFGLTVVILGGALTRLLVTSTFNPLREVEATAARFAAGDFSQRLGGATPNTEVGRLNRSLNAMLARIDLAFADRARTIDQMRRFVGDASHELRTPLVSVRGYAELYRMGALTTPDEVAQAMQRIEKEAIRMGELVTDLLELARIDEAKPLQLAEVDLIPLANDAALDTMAFAPGREVRVIVSEVQIPDATPPVDTDAAPPAPDKTSATLATGPMAFAGATFARLRGRRPRVIEESTSTAAVVQTVALAPRAVVLAEENKIRQVLTNLLGNALRFSPEDTPIEIRVEADRAHGLAVLSVVDHGEGIPPQIREKIFQRFWRADSSRNRDTGGSGLGLAIVASIVAAHKGEVEVVETPGGGATFRVVLPLLPSEKTDETLPILIE